MAITKRPDGRYYLSIVVNGRQYRRICKTRSDAVRLERDLQINDGTHKDTLRLSELVNLWFDYFGCNLKDGKNRTVQLLNIARDMGDLRADKLKPSHYLAYRKKRLESGISANTCNHDLAYLKTVFNKLCKAQYISVNPFKDIPLLSIDERQLTYLTIYQVKRLLVACRQSNNESLLPVVLLCLRTGCRWSEAEKLTKRQLNNNAVTFIKTKSGKNRTVPIRPDFYKVLKARYALPDGRIFANCMSAFRFAVARSGLYFPRGQSAHILRHTYASHFVMNGGDILTLQKILGHSDVKVTMIYAHLSAEHLQDAVKYSLI